MLLFSPIVLRPLTAVSIEERMMKFNGLLFAQVPNTIFILLCYFARRGLVK